jgi:hypothetical protein
MVETSQMQKQPLSAKGYGTCNQLVEQNHELDNSMERRRRRVVPKMKDLARTKAIQKKKRKRKEAKNYSANNGISVGSEFTNQVNISIDSSCSKEISEWRKWVLLHEEPKKVASKVWEFGRKEGVSYSDDERDVVKELEGIEIRDREKNEVNILKDNQGDESNLSGL